MVGVEVGVGVVQLVVVPASSVVKMDTGPESAPTPPWGVGQGVAGEGQEVVGVGALAMGVQEEGMVGALLLHREPATNVDSQDTGQTVAQTD